MCGIIKVSFLSYTSAIYDFKVTILLTELEQTIVDMERRVVPRFQLESDKYVRQRAPRFCRMVLAEGW
jgi:hypothetical protein